MMEASHKYDPSNCNTHYRPPAGLRATSHRSVTSILTWFLLLML